MCFCDIYTLTACPKLHKIKCYYRLCHIHMRMLPPYSPPPSPSSLPRKLRATPSYESLVEALNPVGTSPRLPGFPQPEHKAPYLQCIQNIIPYPSPPQEVQLAKAGCGLSGCKEPDTVGVERVWSGRTEEGEVRFGCPVCKAEEVKAEGEFWVEIAAGMSLPGDDYVEKEKGKGRSKKFRWDRSVGGGEEVSEGSRTRAPEPQLVYTPPPADIARKSRPRPASLPTLVIPQVSTPVPAPAPVLQPESTSFRSTMRRSRSTALASPTPSPPPTVDSD
ncbi:hypothetical protein L873DRAFT_1796986 [Choiromyces venosus 120613-1]|uniref:Uncharacterized protein n=1 Tax=Choiromyces venosus 120613-1 TaxID=1336337 RepID=A0A3N4K694_9PEZI|nr:hypothetical protein L873DRAFT_1796986 [Choiromyces venosus 120613-1]